MDLKESLVLIQDLLTPATKLEQGNKHSFFICLVFLLIEFFESQFKSNKSK